SCFSTRARSGRCGSSRKRRRPRRPVLPRPRPSPPNKVFRQGLPAKFSRGALAMHDIRWIREHAEEFDRGLARRGLPPAARELTALDEKRRAAITKLETALARRNAASKEIGQAKAKKDEARAAALMAEVAGLKAAIEKGEEEQRQTVAALDKALAE